MKKIKLYILLLVAFMTMPLITSCFSESDIDNEIQFPNEQERKEYLKRMQGTYYGKCFYTYLGKDSKGMVLLKRDSIDNVEWVLSEDGKLNIKQVPVSFFAKTLRTGTAFEYVCDALSKHEHVSADINLQLLKSYNNRDFNFYVYPEKNIRIDVEQNGRTNKVVLYYNSSIQIQGLNYNMVGLYKTNENQFFMTLPIGSVSVNDADTGAAPSMFYYVGSKKVNDKEEKK